MFGRLLKLDLPGWSNRCPKTIPCNGRIQQSVFNLFRNRTRFECLNRVRTAFSSFRAAALYISKRSHIEGQTVTSSSIGSRSLADENRDGGLGDDEVADAAQERLLDLSETSRSHDDQSHVLLLRHPQDVLARWPLWPRHPTVAHLCTKQAHSGRCQDKMSRAKCHGLGLCRQRKMFYRGIEIYFL